MSALRRRAPPVRVFLGLGALLAGTPASAQEKPLQEQSLEELLDLKVVTATRSEQTVSEAPAVLTSFLRDDIDALGAQTLADVLKYAPGLEVSMGPGGDYRVAVRGDRKDGNVLLLVDGQPLNDFYDGSAIFDLPASMIERVEVLRGPGSALYGTNAVVGVVHVITLRGRRSVSLAAGQYWTAGGALAWAPEKPAGDGARPVPFHVSAGYLVGDGANAHVPVLPSVVLTGGRSAGADTNRFVRDGYVATGFAQGRWSAEAFGLLRERGTWTGPLFEVTPDNDLEQARLLAGLRYETQAGPKLTLAPRLYSTLVLHDFLQQDYPRGYQAEGSLFPDGAFTRERYDAWTLGAELQGAWKASTKASLLAGLVAERQHLGGYDLARDYRVLGQVPEGALGNHDGVVFAQDGRTRWVQAAYAQAQLHGRLGTTLGLRFDHYSDFGSSLNPRLSFVFRATDRISLKALYAHAFRAPTFRELFDDTRVGRSGVSSNPALDPETIHTAELAAELRTGKLVLRANGFYNRTHDLIGTFDPQGSGARGTIANLGSTWTLGYEAEAFLYLGGRFRVLANASGFRRQFQWSDAPLFDEERRYLEERGHAQLVNMPNFRANLGLELRHRRGSLSLGFANGGKSGANDRSVIEGVRFRLERIVIEDYLRADLVAVQRIAGRLAVTLAVRDVDLFGAKHSDPDESSNINLYGTSGLIQPRYSISLGIRHDF